MKMHKKNKLKIFFYISYANFYIDEYDDSIVWLKMDMKDRKDGLKFQ